MPIDMKAAIAAKAIQLMEKNRNRKLTVKDIVDECGITRQTFYYHFSCVPELICWIIDRNMEELVSRLKAADGDRESIEELLSEGIKYMPYIKAGMDSSYRAEFERIITSRTQSLFRKISEIKGLDRNYPEEEVSFIIKYHGFAMMGLLISWDDSNDIKAISKLIVRMLEGKLPING